MSAKEYEIGKRDLRSLGQTYVDHISAMTAEGLHRKTDIAAELATRDKFVNLLTETLNKITDSNINISNKYDIIVSQVVDLREQLVEAKRSLEGFLGMYIRMVNSGDCGNWDPEEDLEVIAARDVLMEDDVKKERTEAKAVTYCCNYCHNDSNSRVVYGLNGSPLSSTKHICEECLSRLRSKPDKGCKKSLAEDQRFNFCGETGIGQTLPALCTECGGNFKLRKK